ncbi:hypothetical protein HHI36_021764 [Cryptolaemus montrouzieri]|uniref:Uncharacterized protein n=1 Tax=Cryptolaemus montrouzieri TaxID=559131 RepID=A0ABD2MXP1_9CUCU
MKVTKMKSEDSNKKTISIIGKMTEKSSVSLKSSEEKPKGTKNLFDSSDDDDDFLKSLASKKKNSKEHVDTRESISSVKNRESKLFDDDDDEDVFDTSSKVKREIRPSVMSKKTPKSSSLRKLENIEGEEDPLTALLK